MSLAAQQSLESHYVMHTFGRSPVEFVEGHGMKLTGDDGREYLDFLAGIGVCSLGHGDPAVLSALEAQTKKLMHVSNYFYIEQRGQVAALLSKLANDDVDGARVLLTDDGGFAHDILSPRHHVSKTYTVTIDTPLTQEMRTGFAAGVMLADGTALSPAEVTALSPDGCTVRVVLRQGVYHQIKRMFGVYGAGVNALHREAIGGLALDAQLAPGQWRELSDEEVAKITR